MINLLSDTHCYFSGAMLSPIFSLIIGHKIIWQKLLFKQSTLFLVKTISNILGGVLLGEFYPSSLFPY